MSAKTQSIISYITLIGWLIAYFGGKNNRTDLSRYHLKQGLGLFVASFILNIVVFILLLVLPQTVGLVISRVISICILVVLVIGIINASKEEKKPLPIIGKYFENQFAFIDK